MGDAELFLRGEIAILLDSGGDVLFFGLINIIKD